MLNDATFLIYAIDILVKSLHEALILTPYLYLTYLAMEFLESKASKKTINYIQNTKQYGPLIGGLLGLIPQCGFSAVVANLYITGIVTLGTLIAVFLSTSDELLPILISGRVDIEIIIKIILLKTVFAILAGFLIEKHLPKNFISSKKDIDISSLCKKEHCGCDTNKNLYKSAFKHTEKTIIFIFICSLVINTVFYIAGHDIIRSWLLNIPIISKVFASLIGLIPSCYPSVLFAQMYNQNLISASTMLAGSFSNCGIGLLILYRLNTNKEDTLKIIGILFISGVIFGLISSLFI